MAPGRTVHAAGAVTWRRADDRIQVLLVHRPKYDDWTIPKGKLDPGELAVHAAVRELAEETGLRVRLGEPLTRHDYPVRDEPGATKRVHYWVAHPVGADDVAAYAPNHEVDDVRWVPLVDASATLTYDRDREVISKFMTRYERQGAYRSRTLILLRHAQAHPRAHWTGPDEWRTLTEAGEGQAISLARTLHAYGVREIASSHAVRCVATVTPYAKMIGVDVVPDTRLAEKRARRETVRHATSELLDCSVPVVAATHRPVLPYATDALGLEPDPLAPGEMLVVHHRDGDVIATERHLAEAPSPVV